MDEPKDPETCNVFALIRVFGTHDQTQTIRAKYLAGGYGYGQAKNDLFEILRDYLAPFAAKKTELERNYDVIERKLREGAEIMNARMDAVMARVKEVTGV